VVLYTAEQFAAGHSGGAEQDVLSAHQVAGAENGVGVMAGFGLLSALLGALGP
jgi:hypothetical protein